MPVVSNTSPLLNLAIIDRLSLIREQFGKIWIPSAVLEELRIEEDLPGSVVLRDAVRTGWIQLKDVKNQPLVHVLRRDLDYGEAEAIALALQLNAKWVLMDEREGRIISKSLGLHVVGILGILLRARQQGSLSSMRTVMKELVDRAGFRINDALLKRLLMECEEAD